MERIWLQHYPPGMPADVDVHAFTSLVDLQQRSCQRFAALPAYSNRGHALRYAALDQASRDFAAYLQNTLQLVPGERVAIMMPNLLQYPVALFGILRAGLVVVNVNPQYTAPEVQQQLGDSGARAIVVLENFAHTLQQVLDDNPQWHLTTITTEVGDLFPLLPRTLTNAVVRYVRKMVPPWNIPGAVPLRAALGAGRAHTLQPVALGPDDLAFLQYTGGTTGVAKGAMLTHGNMVANLQQVGTWISQRLHEGQEILVCPLPLYHVYALNTALVFLKLGAHTVLVTNPRDMHAFIGDLRRHRFTAMIGVNTLYRALLEAPAFARVDTRSLKVANAGGMAVQRIVAQGWKQATGVAIVESYGLTETSPGALSNPMDIAEWNGTIGMPFPSTEATVRNDSGEDLPPGEVGEICIRGPQVMRGYWQRPRETAEVLDAQGWLHTGDMGFMDANGSFTLTDRKKDMIVVSGFKVFPNQVEDAVALHSGVAEVAAVGIADARSGEAVKLIVVPKDPALTAQALIAHCRLHLTEYKVPKVIEFRQEPLPKTNLGKVLRRQLRDTAPAPPPALQDPAA